MKLNLYSIINNSDLIEKIAVVLFGAVSGTKPTPDTPPDPLPVRVPSGGVTGVKKTFRANRNIQGVFTKVATDLQKTLSKARTNADVQPLFKNQNAITAECLTE